MQSSNSVIIKGVREGLLFILDDDVPFSTVLTELSERISARPDFFKGAEVVINAGRRVMDRPDFDVVYKMLARNGMRVHTFVSLSAQSRMVAEGFGVASRPPAFAGGDARGSFKPRAGDVGPVGAHGLNLAQPKNPPLQDPHRPAEGADAGIFLRRNLRPGELVRYGGDVCVLGDVEVGAEIVAGGYIVIWGALFGAAHAGANGNEDAVVCALHMSPTQLAIAGYMSRFPAQEARYPVGADVGTSSWPVEHTAQNWAHSRHQPLIAGIESGRIVVKAWSGDDYVDSP